MREHAPKNSPNYSTVRREKLPYADTLVLLLFFLSGDDFLAVHTTVAFATGYSPARPFGHPGFGGPGAYIIFRHANTGGPNEARTRDLPLARRVLSRTELSAHMAIPFTAARYTGTHNLHVQSQG